MAVTGLTMRLVDDLRTQLDLIVDQQTRDLVKAWAEAWDEIAPDLEQALVDITTTGSDTGLIGRMQLMRSSQLFQSLEVIARNLGQLTHDAGIRVGADLPAIIRDAGAAQQAILASQLPADRIDLQGWDRVDPRQIAAIVHRTTQQITSLTRPLAPQAYAAVRSELLRGVAAGTNPKATAARMLQRAEGQFNGGLARALNIARTESLDAHRTAAQLAHSANADVLAGWVWLATLDGRTCRGCWGMAGSEHPLSEPGPQGHQQCRCSRMPETKSWADLGFDIPEPPSVLPDAGQRFDGLSPSEQRGILGVRGYDAWKSGRWPMDQWAQKRSNPGWRDAFYEAPAPR